MARCSTTPWCSTAAASATGTATRITICRWFWRAEAQARFLTHRFLEDWGYQALIRREARVFSQAQFGTRDPNPEDPDQIAAVCQVIQRCLGQTLGRLQERGIGADLSLAPDSVRLPWRRTFEVDFDLL